MSNDLKFFVGELQKSISGDEKERATDLLKTIVETPFPADLQPAFKAITSAIHAAEKQYPDDEDIIKLCRSIHSKWEDAMQSKKASKPHVVKSTQRMPPVDTTRRPPYEVIRKALLALESSKSASLAAEIEHHAFTKYGSKFSNYQNKIVSLASNLKRNKELVEALGDGRVSCEDLVQMSLKDLANSQIKDTRAEFAKSDADASQLDWYAENRVEFNGKNGIKVTEANDLDDDVANSFLH